MSPSLRGHFSHCGHIANLFQKMTWPLDSVSPNTTTITADTRPHRGNMMTNVATLMARSYVGVGSSAGCQLQAFLIQM